MIRQANFDVLSVEKQDACQREFGDCTIGLQLSSECRLVSTQSSENSATVTQVTHLPLTREVLPPILCSTQGSPSLLHSGKVIASGAQIAQVSRSHVVSLDLKFCKLSALPLASFAWM